MSRGLLATCIALLALVVPSTALAQERTVAVNGSVTQKIPNDTASLSLSVSRERRTRGAALRATSRTLRRVIAAVQAIPGVGDGDVRTGRISVRKLTRDGKVIFSAGEGIGVTLHQPGEAGNLISAAIAAGASGTGGPNFFAGNAEEAYDQALVAAFDEAKARAGALAARAGSVLGPVLSIEEGGGVESQSPNVES
ncbi:MAG TPA: SIMPL domain-containing protein, partial [Solirubrobacterales bacterium]|nr:SIMPL domain-containing protein [Solirubrobacterales bacterium]